MPRTARKLDQDLRDYPTYTISEAATYLAIPRRTLYHWISDEPLWTTAGAGGEMQLLSFRDVAQAYFIEFIRKHVGITGRKAREILKSARLETGARYPLLDKDIKVLFQQILVANKSTTSAITSCRCWLKSTTWRGFEPLAGRDVYKRQLRRNRKRNVVLAL